MASPTFFSDGNTPNSRDTQWRIAQKILGAIIDGGGGGGGGGVGAVYSGNGSPSGVITPTASAAIYYDLSAPYTTYKWDGAQWT